MASCCPSVQDVQRRRCEFLAHLQVGWPHIGAGVLDARNRVGVQKIKNPFRLSSDRSLRTYRSLLKPCSLSPSNSAVSPTWAKQSIRERLLIVAAGPRDSFCGHATTAAVPPSHPVDEKYGDAPKRNKFKPAQARNEPQIGRDPRRGRNVNSISPAFVMHASEYTKPFCFSTRLRIVFRCILMPVVGAFPVLIVTPNRI